MALLTVPGSVRWAWALSLPLFAVTSPGMAQGYGWSRSDGDAAGTRSSALTSINPGNVGALRPVWTFATGNLLGHLGSPLVIDSTLVLSTPWPVTIYALDLAKPGAPIRWQRRISEGQRPPDGCCHGIGGGVAYHESGLIVATAPPGLVVAFDLDTGKERWRTSVGQGVERTTLEGVPFLAGDVVIVGLGARGSPGRGGVAALAVQTGNQIWRKWNTGPDRDVGITGPGNLRYPSHRPPDRGVVSWPDSGWIRAGGGSPGRFSWDPTLDLIYHGSDASVPTRDPGRTGDGKWTSSLIARDRKTGVVRWVYQTTPGDTNGYGAASGGQLVDFALGGRTIPALVHFSPNGFAYTLDRSNGQVILAERYGPVNWASHIDRTSRVPIAPAAAGAGPVCPASVGGKGLQPSAVLPTTSVFFVPVANLCMTTRVTERVSRTELTIGPGGNGGRVVAWDAASGTIRWEVPERWPVLGGALTTTSGLIFYGTLDGWLKALDSSTGRPLWQFKLPSGVIGDPFAFRSVDGREFIGVVAGVGGWIGGVLGQGADRYGAKQALGELAQIVTPGGVLVVFGLPE